jgi:hypothetical protein
MTAITEPGQYDMAADIYHSDPVPGGSLSSTGARRILPPGCPALFAHEREHGEQNRPQFDLGTAAHKMVLGVGPTITKVDTRDWRTKAAQEARDAAHAEGAVPLLTADYERVTGMAAALRRNDIAMALLNPDYGKPEQAIFWQDTETDVWRRALIDWLPDLGTGRPIVVDYKSTVSAERDAIRKSVARYGYHQQDPWYLDAVEAIGYPPDTAFVFLFQEKTPPYLITPVQLRDSARAIGRDRNCRAIEIYRDCTETGIWPGHATDDDSGFAYIGLPVWVEREHFEEYA